MSGLISAVCLASILTAALPTIGTAQEDHAVPARTEGPGSVSVNTSVRADTTDSYDSNALRLETHMGEFRIVRGINGPVVGKIGIFSRPDMAQLVAPSENALHEGREFNRNHGPGMAAGVAGMVVFATAIAASHAAGPNWGLTAATVGGGALMVYGGIKLDRAYSSLSKAIWWYNRDLRK
jgi:hypothetical protein